MRFEVEGGTRGGPDIDSGAYDRWKLATPPDLEEFLEDDDLMEILDAEEADKQWKESQGE